MRITSLETRTAELPYRESIAWQGSEEASGHYLFLRITADSGVFGLAEVAEKPTWTGNAPAVTAAALHEIYAPLLIGMDPLRPERIAAALGTIPGWSTAKALVDMALHDLVARHRGLPLWKHLGGWTDEVPVSWLVNRGPAAQRLEEIDEMIGRFGFWALKVKIGTDPTGDIQYVHQIRSRFGPELVIQVDANGAYDLNMAVHVSDALAEAGVALFEDPCALPLSERTRWFLERSRVPIMVDFAAASPALVQQYVGLGASAIAIKLPRTGICSSNKIRDICEDNGVLTGIGLYAESSVGTLMSLHYHGASRHFQAIPAENCFFLKLRRDVVDSVPDIRGGRVKLSDRPGLGVDIDPALWREMASRN